MIGLLVDGIALTIVSLFGVIGTILSMIVLLKPGIHDLFSSFLTALSMFDTIFLILAIFYLGLPELFDWYAKNVSLYITPILHGLIHVARSGSVYVTMAVTIERYFAIVHPLKDFKIKKALLPIAVLFAIVYNIPKFLEIESYQFTVSQRGLRKSSISENPYYATYYVFWSKVFLMELIPYALITILNGFIIAKIYSSYKFRKQFIVNRRPSSPGEQQRKYSSIPVIQEEENLVDEEEKICFIKPRSTSLRPPDSPEKIVTIVSPSPSVDKLNKKPKAKKQHLEIVEPNSVTKANGDHRRKSTLSITTTTADQNNRNCGPEKVLKPKETQLAITLVAISLLFIICQSMKFIPDIYEMKYCDHFKMAATKGDKMCIVPAFVDTMLSISNLFCCINSAGNFLLYMIRGKKFRDAFMKMYCRCVMRATYLRTGGSPIGLSMNTLDPNCSTKVTTMNGSKNYIRSPVRGIHV